jgi:hypothetical protein
VSKDVRGKLKQLRLRVKLINSSTCKDFKIKV